MIVAAKRDASQSLRRGATIYTWHLQEIGEDGKGAGSEWGPGGGGCAQEEKWRTT